MSGKSSSKKHRTHPEPLAARIGLRIKALRVEADYSFEEFLGQTGLSRGYLSELERGLVVPTVTKLAVVAKALDLTIADLVIGDTPREQLLEESRGMTDCEVQELLRAARKAGGVE